MEGRVRKGRGEKRGGGIEMGRVRGRMVFGEKKRERERRRGRVEGNVMLCLFGGWMDWMDWMVLFLFG